MTTIVALACSDGSVALAADDVGWYGGAPMPAPNKLFHPLQPDTDGRSPTVVLGMAGSARVGVAARRSLLVATPQGRWSADQLDEWAQDVSEALLDLALDLRARPGLEQNDSEWNAVLAAHGRWWFLEGGVASGETGRRPFEGCGSGSDFALGYIAARLHLNHGVLPASAEGRRWVREAVQVSTELTNTALVEIAPRVLVAAAPDTA